MSKYRYARSNGQFLPSEFVDSVWDITSQNFRSDQSYDLAKDFVTGTRASENSFVSDTEIASYTAKPKSLVAWWRPGNKDFVKKVADNSLNDHALETGSGTPTLSSGVTPSSFVSSGSVSFDGSSFMKTNDDAAVTSLSFTDGNKDKPFSISLWLRRNLAASSFLLGKGQYTTGEPEYGLWLNNLGGLVVYIVDREQPWLTWAGAWVDTGSVPLNTWCHIVITYDGTAASVAGTSEYSGVKIYIDGVSWAASYSTSADYECMRTNSDTSKGQFSLGGWDSSWETTANFADVAVWNRELTATDVANIYGVRTAGAYRQVRNFEQVSPDNDTRVLGISTQKKGFNTTGFPEDIMNQYVQGINITSFDQLLNYSAYRIRPNSSFIKTLRGKDVSRTTFDDSIATTSISSGSHTSHVFLGGEGRLSERLSHERENRDLGQTAVYDVPGPFEDTLDLNPTAIVSRFPEDLILPLQMVCQTSNELNDGAIEPLLIRELIDGSSIEGPFYSHVFRASLGGMTDPFRRSYVIVDGQNMHDIRSYAGAAPFLDAVEHLGTTDMPGAFSDLSAVVAPYVDYLNDADKEYTTNETSSTISQVLIHSASWTDSDDRTFDKMAPRGFVFDNNPLGFDSIAFGGLMKSSRGKK